MERYIPVCSYCQREFSNDNIITLDHIKPCLKSTRHGGNLSRVTGLKGLQNLLLSCHDCNNLKGKLKLEQFKEMLYNTPLEKRTLFQCKGRRRIPNWIRKDNVKNTMINSINILLTKNEFEELPVKYFNYD